MPEIIEVEFHSKYLSDFQMSRLVQASLRKYTVPITAFIGVLACPSITFSKTMRTEQPMAASFEQKKFRGPGKKGVFGFLRREKEITLLVASNVGAGDGVFSNCFGRVNGSNPIQG